MNTARNVSILGLALVSLLAVPRTAKTSALPSPIRSHCYSGQPFNGLLNPKRLAKHSAPFRKAAEEAWRATHNGDAPFEAGFSINDDGHPGKLQLSLFEAVDAATHLTLVSSTSALGTLHVHNKFGESTPSAADVRSAKSLRKTVFVESRTGLYSINPDGTVFHVFNEADWFSRQCAN